MLICNNSAVAEGDFRTRWAFETLHASGDIDSFRLIPFGEAGSLMRTRFLADVSEQVADYRPDVVIWHKDDGKDLSHDLVARIAAKTRLVYHDLDPWMWWIKPVQPNQRILSRYASLVFLCGLGSIAAQFKEATDRIRYSPHGYYDIDIPPPVTVKVPHMIFIGSIHRRAKRLLGRFAPEQHSGRTRAVWILRRRLGKQFEVYGTGYPADWKIQPCEFQRQFELINRSLASFAIDAAPKAPFYFSNRTPFSLACGSIHFKISRKGDEEQFGDCPGLISVPDPDNAADMFEEVCDWTEKQREEISAETREFARQRLRQPDLYREMLILAAEASISDR